MKLEKYRNSLFRFALNLTNDWNSAEDLTQDTLMQAIENSHQLKERDKALGWLVKIARNIWIDSLRKRKLPTKELDENQDASPAWHPCFGQSSMNETLEEILWQMKKLPQRQREVLYLHAVEDFSIDEISASLELNCNAVKASLSLARKAMRSHTNRQQPS